MNKLCRKVLLLRLPITILATPLCATSIKSTSIETKNEDSKAYQDMLKQEAINQADDEGDRTISSINEEMDSAYCNMLEEENYIVELINGIDDASTSFSNWKYNLNYLKDNYEKINKMADVNMDYVDNYIEGYTYTLHSMEAPEEIEKEERHAFSSYSASNAVDYALDYIGDYNSSYPDWSSEGGDCANFVSQCLFAGGKPMEGTPGTTSAAQDWDNWFSKGNSRNTKNVSSTWRGAAAFRDYWQRNASDYEKFTSMDSSAYNFGYKGDAISLLNSNGRAYHTLFIVGYGSRDFKIAAHTDSYVSGDEPYLLSERNLSNGFIIYNID